MGNKFPMVAKTFQGLEDVLHDELVRLGAEHVEIGLRMVSFEGDLSMMYRANMCCRTALRILKPICKFSANNTDELYDIVRDIEWEKYLSENQTFSVDSTVNSNEFTHSRFVTYRVKDGIVDHFNDKYGKRPSIRINGADVQLNVHISDTRVTISLDSSGDPLNKRGYRVASVDAPINEVLAAGIIMKTGWHGESDFIDPMCGSGTFLIEAALIAANINPGVYRKKFAFENWPDFDRELFEEIYNDDSSEREFSHKIYGGDILSVSVAAAKRNIREAHLEGQIEVVCRPMSEWEEPPLEGILITNPPYGERLKPDDMKGLYHSIGSTLKHKFRGYHAWILGYKDEYFDEIGLHPSIKFPILNGNLECSLREYVIFEGGMRDFKSDGGIIRNDNFRCEAKPKIRRMSDDEWDQESRRFEGKRKERKDSKSKRSDKKNSRARKEDRKNFRSSREERHEAKSRRDSFDGKRNTKPQFGKGPSIPKSEEIRFSDRAMRSRRGWKTRFDEED